MRRERLVLKLLLLLTREWATEGEGIGREGRGEVWAEEGNSCSGETGVWVVG